MSLGCHSNKLYTFGGQEDENNKLDDLWCFDMVSQKWSQIESGADEWKPVARSGHTSCVWGEKMYIFGGIFELTKELNDLAAFDFTTKKWCHFESEAEQLERSN